MNLTLTNNTAIESGIFGTLTSDDDTFSCVTLLKLTTLFPALKLTGR